MWISLGPWIWNSSDMGGTGCWSPPAGTLGLLDLRPLPDQALRVHGDHPYGLFVTTDKVDDQSFLVLGQNRIDQIVPGPSARSYFAQIFGVQPIGTTLADWLWNLLTVQADPLGLDRPKPLMPGRNGVTELLLGGHSRVRSERFNLARGGQYENVVRDLLRADFARFMREVPEEAARRHLGALVRKYHVDFREITCEIQPAHPGTRVYESFNGANSETLGKDQTWVEHTGTWDNYSNAARVTSTTTQSYAYCTATVSSDDLICLSRFPFVATYSTNTAMGRAQTDAFTGYTHFYYDTYSRLRKWVSGTPTDLGSSETWTRDILTNNITMLVECNGSSQKAFYGNHTSSNLIASDTAISSGPRGGLYGYDATYAALADDWELIDNAVLQHWNWDSADGHVDEGLAALLACSCTESACQGRIDGKSKSGTEHWEQPTSTYTWEDWGVPSGNTVTYVRALDVWGAVTEWYGGLSAGPGYWHVLSGGTSVTTNPLATIGTYGTGVGETWFMQLTSRQAVNSSYAASTTNIEDRWAISLATGSTNSAYLEVQQKSHTLLIEYTPPVEEIVYPTVLSATTSIVTPLIALEGFVYPAVLSATTSIVAPSIATLQTIYASALSVAANLISSAVVIDATWIATALTASSAVIDPVVDIGSTGITVFPLPLEATASVIQPAIAIDAIYAASSLTTTAAVIQPALATEIVYAASPLTTTASVIQPALAIDATHAASPLTTTAAVIFPLVVIDYTLAATALSVDTSVVAPAVVVDCLYAPPALLAAALLVLPGVTIDATYLASVLSVTGTVIAPEVFGGTVVQVSALSASASVVTPTIQVDVAIAPAVLSAVAAIIAPIIAVSGNVLIEPAVLSATSSVVAPLIRVDATYSAAALISTINLGVPSTIVDCTISASALIASVVVIDPAVAIAGNILIQPSALIATASALAPTFKIDGSCSPAVVAATASVRAPLVAIDVLVVSSVLTSTAAVVAPAIKFDATVAVAALSASASVVEPTLRIDAIVMPSPLSAVVTLNDPVVFVGGVVCSVHWWLASGGEMTPTGIFIGGRM